MSRPTVPVLASALATLLSSPVHPSSTTRTDLQKQVPVYLKDCGESCARAKELSSSDARALLAQHPELVALTALAQISKVPGQPAAFVASAAVKPASDKDYGRRLILFHRVSSKFEKRAQTHGAGDSYAYDPIYFVGAHRTFVLARTGAESEWGYDVFEIRDDAWVDLGTLPVVSPNEEEDTVGVLGAALESGQLVIEFNTPTVVEVGAGDERKPIERAGNKPIAFVQRGKQFVHIR